MAALVAFLLGALLGIAVAAAVAAHLNRRTVARVRTAEQRAIRAERLAEIGAMTGGLAHEIKNPLSTIGLNAQLLTEAIEDLPIDDAERTRLARRMSTLSREVERLRGILTDFLQYAGELHLEPGPADLNAAAEELVDFFLPQAESQGVRLRAELAPGPLRARLDVPHVKQAALNLMLNAVQAMAGPAGERPRELILRTARASDRDRVPVLALHVIDTGPGIDDARRARIFEPYFTTKSGGTGLGLPTARRIAEAHGGRLEVHSEPGKGTDFSLVFPAMVPDDERGGQG